MAGTATQVSDFSVVTILALAIKRVEGYYPASRSWRDNNPGNLEETGTAGKDGVYAKFATYEDGWERLLMDVRMKMHEHPDKSLFQVMEIYAPAADHNDPKSYASFIAHTLATDLAADITVDTTMASLLELQEKRDALKQVA